MKKHWVNPNCQNSEPTKRTVSISAMVKILWFAMQNDHRVLYQLLKKDNEKPTPKQILGNHVPKTFTARRWHSGHNGVK